MQDRTAAYRKLQSLRLMTVEHGCTAPEAATARRLADQLAQRWGFGDVAQDPDVSEADYQAQEQAAAQRWKWEYRRCGKPRCWCAADTRGHGPYKYGKRRTGSTVRSIYLGR